MLICVGNGSLRLHWYNITYPWSCLHSHTLWPFFSLIELGVQAFQYHISNVSMTIKLIQFEDLTNRYSHKST